MACCRSGSANLPLIFAVSSLEVFLSAVFRKCNKQLSLLKQIVINALGQRAAFVVSGVDGVKSQLRKMVKAAGARFLARDAERYSFRNCIFVIAHMRCGSTALSNIICSRDDVTGYGEAHIRYDARSAIGALALNMRRRGGWTPGARYFFDKILHSRHDLAAPPEFFQSRAIFMLREPEPAIRSIFKLYRDLGRSEYGTHALAADYYIERVTAMAALWARFAPGQRFGLTHADLLSDPEGLLATMSDALRFDPPLRNSYQSLAASRVGGGGDPMVSGQHNRIEPGLLKPAGDLGNLDLAAGQAESAICAFEAMARLIARQSQNP